ncbi:MAG: acyltransferase [Acetobacteraceae bacterium]|nr:acyltransferase [Pseudomonadota bacterium]
MAKMNESTSQFLDAARWISALAVVVSHVCGLLLFNPDRVPEPSAALTAFFSLRNAGHVAVVIFFVLSGYLVGGIELARILDGQRFSVRRYAVQRVSRIYVVLIPALLLTLLFDGLGQSLFKNSLLYTTWAADGIDSLKYVIAERHDAATLGGNILMLQTIAVPPFGSNGPLWSLANECWYYLIFGLVLMALSAGRSLLSRGAALATAVVAIGVLPYTISWWFAIWLFGAGLALLDRYRRGLAFRPALAIAVAGLGLCLYAMTWPHPLAALPDSMRPAVGWLLDCVVALSFGVVLLSAKNAAWSRWRRMHAALAGFSFSLYLVHFPALILLGAAAHDRFGVALAQPPRTGNLLLVVGFVAVLTAFAWGFAMVTERHTAVVRDALMRVAPRARRLG